MFPSMHVLARPGSRATRQVLEAPDTVGDRLRAVVAEHARAEADNTRCYDARMQAIMDALFAQMLVMAPIEPHLALSAPLESRE